MKLSIAGFDVRNPKEIKITKQKILKIKTKN